MSPALVLMAACAVREDGRDGIPIGLLLSYSGYLAANSVNSERAVIMAVDAANVGGGVDGRRFTVISRNTRSDVSAVKRQAQELLDAGVAAFIGPDATDFATALMPLLGSRTIILPSSNTSSDVEWRPSWWFVMGPGSSRFACELVSQLRADGRQKTLVIVNPTGQNVDLSWSLGLSYGLPKVILGDVLTAEDVRRILQERADSYVLAALPEAASSLVYAMTAAGSPKSPTQWYLSPTLHTPAFLESSPKGALRGARGVSAATGPGAAEFSVRFAERWQDAPLDDAYPFYDAGAVAVLAVARALARTGSIPDGTALGEHVIAVTRAGGLPVQWNELARGLELLKEGREVEYVGLSGVIQFDSSGQTPPPSTTWWTIGEDGFQDIGSQSDCHLP
jgi:neutral amino acid transport system substrate-binding protein